MSFGSLVRILEKNFDVEEYLAEKDHKLSGGEFVLDCPCEECEAAGKKQKLWVRVKEKPGHAAGAWTCWFSGSSGAGPLSLVQLLEGCSFAEGLRRLNEGAKPNVEAPKGLREAVVRRLAEIAPPPDAVVKLAEPTPLPREAVPVDPEDPPQYVVDRGITPDQVNEYDLHVCTTGGFHDRLIFPVKRNKKTWWFLARWMGKPPEGVKKVLNSKNSNASHFLYGWDQAKGAPRGVLVENVFSAMRVGRGGLCTFGSHFSFAQLDLLARLDVEEVILMFDRDFTVKRRAHVAGKRPPPTAWDIAQGLAPFWPVRVVTLPDARGPDEHSRSDLRRMVDAAPLLGERQTFRRRVVARLDVQEKSPRRRGVEGTQKPATAVETSSRVGR